MSTGRLFPLLMKKLLIHFLFSISLLKLPVVDGLYSTPAIGNEFDDEWIYSSVPTASAASNVSQKCLQHTEEYLTALQNRRPWAVTMYESSGRLLEDLIHIEGSDTLHHESGLFDECLSIESDEIPFQGQYCTVFFGLKPMEKEETNVYQGYISNTSTDEQLNEGIEPVENIYYYQKPSVGFCLPSTCNANDLRSAVAQLLGYRTIKEKNFSIVAIANENNCYTQKKIDASRTTFDYVTIAVMFAFSLLGITVATATVHDIWKGNNSESFVFQLLYCFSAKKNCATLFSTEDTKESLSCVSGIRVLTTCWVVLIHVGGAFPLLRLIYNREMIMKKSLKWEYQFAANGLFAVDTFFLMSGLLVAYTKLRQLDQNNGIFNLKRFYFHRYIRLTPVYAVLMAFIATLYPYVGTGPDWNLVVQKSKALRKTWWTNMMYINNYVNPIGNTTNPEYPIAETWYLACDMQMFWLSPLFIYPIWRWKRLGIIWTAFSLLVVLGISAIVFIVHDLPATMLYLRPSDMAKMDLYAEKHYLDTFARIPPYLIGILLGWLLYKTKDKSIYINKFLVAGGWMTALFLALSIIYGMFPYVDENLVPVINPWIRVSYGVLHHSAWAITVGWIIFACTHGYGGFVQQFLSWKLFVPLSRLSYAVYLIHPSYIFTYIFHLRKPYYFTEMSGFVNSSGILVISFLLAIVISVTVEMPFINLDQLLFANKSKALQKGKKKA